MKQKIICAFIVFFILNNIQAQTDPTLKKLLAINYVLYRNHSVDSLVKILPANYLDMAITPAYRGDYGDVLVVQYPNNIWLWIVVRNFKYMNPLLNKTDTTKRPDVNWKIDLFKKEAIAYTILFQGATCYDGCQNDARFSGQ